MVEAYAWEVLVRRWRIAWLFLGLAVVSPAWADEHVCRSPLTDWQPPTALVDSLTAAGWRDIRVRIDDGCYKARATNERGERLEQKFDPATLAPLPRGGGERHGHD